MSQENPTPDEVRYWAEVEHREVVAQATERHLDRLAAEERRFREELAHFENVRQLRLGANYEVPGQVLRAGGEPEARQPDE